MRGRQHGLHRRRVVIGGHRENRSAHHRCEPAWVQLAHASHRRGRVPCRSGCCPRRKSPLAMDPARTAAPGTPQRRLRRTVTRRRAAAPPPLLTQETARSVRPLPLHTRTGTRMQKLCSGVWQTTAERDGPCSTERTAEPSRAVPKVLTALVVRPGTGTASPWSCCPAFPRRRTRRGIA